MQLIRSWVIIFFHDGDWNYLLCMHKSMDQPFRFHVGDTFSLWHKERFIDAEIEGVRYVFNRSEFRIRAKSTAGVWLSAEEIRDYLIAEGWSEGPAEVFPRHSWTTETPGTPTPISARLSHDNPVQCVHS